DASGRVRIVLDSRLRLPAAGKLATTARTLPTWVFAAEGAANLAIETLAAFGVEVILVPAGKSGHLDLKAVTQELGRRGLTRVLVEGGAQLAGRLVANGLVDGLVWFRAPKLIGGDGLPAAAGLDVGALANAPGFVRTGVREMGPDVMETYARAP
ncbi:MAG: RibD family protein, partial [Alphaproteobacteria bacterium]|nr:RibD family protein [Alphaproteobacteria bacterium]